MSKKPNDESRIAGLASILQSANKVKESPSPVPTPVEPLVINPPAPLRKAAPVGKSVDPAYRFAGVYLRKDTQRKARRRLEDLEIDQDFSELVEELLQQWLKATG